MSPTCVSARLWCWLTLCAHAYAQPSPSMSFLRLRAGTEADEISLPRQLLYRLCSLLSRTSYLTGKCLHNHGVVFPAGPLGGFAGVGSVTGNRYRLPA